MARLWGAAGEEGPAPASRRMSQATCSSASLCESLTYLDPDGADSAAFAADALAGLPADLPSAIAERVARGVAVLDKLCLEIGLSGAEQDVVRCRLWHAACQSVSLQTSDLERACAKLREAVGALRSSRDSLVRQLGDAACGDDAAEEPLVAQRDALRADIDRLGLVKADRLELFGTLRRVDAAIAADLAEGTRRPLRIEPAEALPSAPDLSVARLEEMCTLCHRSQQARAEQLVQRCSELEAAAHVEWDKLREPAHSRRAFLASLPEHQPDADLPALTTAALRQHQGREDALLGANGAAERVSALQSKLEHIKAEFRDQLQAQVLETKGLLHKLWAEYWELTRDEAYNPSAVIGNYDDSSAVVRDFPDDPTEVNLALIESEVLQVQERCALVKSVVALLQRRDEILEARRQLDVAAQDKDRLLSKSRNMAAQLLQEEKTRNAVKRELPRLERQLHMFVVDFEAKSGLPFKYCGRSLLEQLPGIQPELPKRHNSATTLKPDRCASSACRNPSPVVGHPSRQRPRANTAH
eukprot:TRINITY_DN6773_c0_g1_i1.p1 TRINITY_DN6773_c0_g1~~TRINITY_DN6773_c0_g1_i1.p1  ORF type:complete len:529 (+),score=167.22 TRINITY_DN6773_c0_g1_i1:55-1641(+)